jgi:pilus assembly protein Flp/PilA
MLRTFFAREHGQGLVEYALIILSIAIAVIAAVTAFGQELLATYDFILTSWP